ncbi:MAG TPA: hypothetical protein VG096_02180 [Bryobacteraceae bacterium]|jgi:hypothetical protein|nr:hypothetical protein [Bryobacteraceae bacterium]
MTITYANGQTIKAALVVRTDNRIRVALAGFDDFTEFTQINGTWVSEDCEAVQIEFGWPGRANRAYKEEDFICSQELAAKLIHRLLNTEQDEEEELSVPVTLKSLDSTAGRLVV